MKNNITELVFILDRSGSMGGLESDTIGGFNSMIKKQKETEGEVIVSTVLFDDKVEILHDRVPLEKIAAMTEEEYYVRGCTALLDAIGSAIKHIGGIHKKGERPEKTLFVITTDGQENSSTEYTYQKVKKMIERKKEKFGWEFLFLGANIDAAAEADKLGISREKTVKYRSDSKGTRVNYVALASAICNFRNSAEGKVPDNWKEEIDEYCKEENV